VQVDEIESACRRLSCVHPGVCDNLQTDHGPLLDLLRKVRASPGSASLHRLRHPHRPRRALAQFVRELAQHHTGGQLSVAPEHVSEAVLDKMKKPGVASYERFAEQFACASQDAGKEQHLVPYYISGHPGSTLPT
jgi:radical SAM superfamily enzyme YgiQ (UPF0313 family)